MTTLIAGTAFAQSPLRYTVTDLGSLGGWGYAATGLNNKGQSVGISNNEAFFKAPHFNWQPRVETLKP